MAIALSYIVWPFDLIPDSIPVWGYLDDLLVVILGFLFIKMFVPQELLAEHADDKSCQKNQRAELLNGFSEIKTVIFTVGLLFLFFAVIYKASTIHWPEAANYMMSIAKLIAYD